MDQLIINEDWRSIDGYINYQVSNIGRVRNSKTGKMLKQHLGTSGYYALGLFKKVERKYHAMHQLVAHDFLEEPDSIRDYVIDHIDHDTTNNKMYNLRCASLSQNQMNRVKHITSEAGSKYKGVFKDKKKWRASVQHQGNRYSLGNYDSEEEAARAYNNKAVELAG